MQCEHIYVNLQRCPSEAVILTRGDVEDCGPYFLWQMFVCPKHAPYGTSAWRQLDSLFLKAFDIGQMDGMFILVKDEQLFDWVFGESDLMPRDPRDGTWAGESYSELGLPHDEDDELHDWFSDGLCLGFHRAMLERFSQLALV